MRREISIYKYLPGVLRIFWVNNSYDFECWDCVLCKKFED